MKPLPRSLLLALGLALAGCYPYDTSIKLCEDAVPEGGCPTGRGGTCDDPACKALYDCIDAVWKQTSTCDGGAGGSTATGGFAGSTPTGGTAGAGGSTATGGAGGCAPIALDHTGETTGCSPPLQPPDCPAVAAEQCPESACLTDCADFYLCRLEMGSPAWVPVAYCDLDGVLVLSP